MPSNHRPGSAGLLHSCTRRIQPIVMALLTLLCRPAWGAAKVEVAELRGIIHPLSAGYLIDAMDQADADGAALLVIEMDTPGGLLDSTKDIVQRMLASRTPVAVFVTPAGARATSAGFMLLIASDIAAMSPGTNTGAAHPVEVGSENSADDIGLKKAESDSAAFARTIAANRRRNVALSEKAVVESRSFTEAEALQEGLIDLVARDRSELLSKLNGRKIHRFDGAELVLDTTGPVDEPIPKSLVQKYLGPLLSPELVLLLLGVGIVGLYIELSHPGMVLPGVVGVLCLLLFALAFRYLPVNAVGLLLIALGVTLFVVEIKIHSYGALTLGGMACLIAGMLMLFPRDVPALRVPLSFVLPLALTIGLFVAGVVRLVSRAQRSPVVTGIEGVVGAAGRAWSDLSPEGKVFVHGEIWDARAPEPVSSGEEIRVTGVQGLRVTVERAGGGPGGGPASVRPGAPPGKAEKV